MLKTLLSPQRRVSRGMCLFVVALSPKRRAHFWNFVFALFLNFTPLSSQALTFVNAKMDGNLWFFCFRILALRCSYHKIIKNIICLEHFWAKMELSLRFRASDVRRLIAGAANPSSSTAIGPLGAHLDPRWFSAIYLVVEPTSRRGAKIASR